MTRDEDRAKGVLDLFNAVLSIHTTEVLERKREQEKLAAGQTLQPMTWESLLKNLPGF